jgi:hypothetical protein
MCKVKTDVAQVIECLPHKDEALSSNPSTTKTKQTDNKKNPSTTKTKQTDNNKKKNKLNKHW